MTVKTKSSRPHEVAKLVEEVTLLTDDEAFSLHGIEYYEDGTLYDDIEGVEYESLAAWAEVQISTMYDAKFEKRHSHHSYEE